MILVAALAAGLLAYGTARALLPPALFLLTQGGLVRRNYRGDELATGAGIVIPLASLAPWGLFLLIPAGGEGESRFSAPTALWIALLFGMALLGLLDDALGNRETRGLKGHLRALLSGRPTTGSFKALFGGALGLVGGLWLHGPTLAGLVGGLLIALFANAMNLLDVRPGRALKGALVSFILGTGAAWQHPGAWAGASIVHAAAPIGAACALWRPDHKGTLMLGDTGANVLGAAAGIVWASAPFSWQVLVVALLLLMHLYAERRSLSALIESVPLLSRLDRWGR